MESGLHHHTRASSSSTLNPQQVLILKRGRGVERRLSHLIPDMFLVHFLVIYFVLHTLINIVLVQLVPFAHPRGSADSLEQ